MPIEVKGFNHVLVPTGDVDSTRAFYRDVLGLEPIKPLATGYQHFNMAWLDGRGQEIHIVERNPGLTEETGEDFNQTMQSHIAFEVTSIDDAKTELESRGLDYYEQKGEGILTRRQIYVEDPSGLVVELFETKSP